MDIETLIQFGTVDEGAVPDRHWLDAAEVVVRHRQPSESVVAPTELGPAIGPVVPYRLARNLQPTWLVVHKGRLEEIGKPLLERAVEKMVPVHANEVFVVFGGRGGLTPIRQRDQHLKALVNRLPETPDTTTRGVNSGAAVLLPDEIAWLPRGDLERFCRDACRSAYLGDHTLVCRVLTRYLVYADTSDDSLTPHLALDGIWEAWITQLLARSVRAGDGCVDVGANLGYFSLLMAELTGPRGRVLAVEPNPRLVSLVERSLATNGFSDWAGVRAAAVTDAAQGRVRLNIPSRHLADASLQTDLTGSAGGETIEVEARGLDELLDGWERVDIVKVDAEGAEAAVWRSMRATLERHPGVTVVLEFTPSRMSDPRGFLDEISGQGFRLRCVEHDASLRELTVDECLTAQPWWMLYLSRK